MSRFTDALIVSPLADGNTWVLIRDFGYEVGAEGSGDIIDCKIGFMTDFASIPRPFWAILPKWGKYGNAAVVHDWLYWSQRRTRAQSDQILFEGMGALSVPAWQRYLIYWAVRLFGIFAWLRNRWDREAGFERVISNGKIKAIQFSERPGLFRRMARHQINKIKRSFSTKN